MAVTNDYKNAVGLSAPEDCVISVSRSICRLQLVGEIELSKLVNDLKKCAQASHADGAVDLTCLISNSDAHVLSANGFFCTAFQAELRNNLCIETGYLLTDERGYNHFIKHETLSYVWKYFRSVAGEQKSAGAIQGALACTVLAALIMIGPILQALGFIGG